MGCCDSVRGHIAYRECHRHYCVGSDEHERHRHHKPQQYCYWSHCLYSSFMCDRLFLSACHACISSKRVSLLSTPDCGRLLMEHAKSKLRARLMRSRVTTRF